MAAQTETTSEARPIVGSKRIQCVVVTPEKKVVDEVVDFVALPLFDGELGVLPGRTPLIGRLGFGELRTRTGDLVHRFYVDGGFAQVRDDVVTVLTNRALPVESIDAAAATRDLEKAEEQEALSDHDVAEKTKAIARSRAMLRVARRRPGS
jgi:F-type H+-transporting ATPase subunit epsilon